MVGLPAMAGKVEALLVWLTTSHRMRRCEHIVQQRRQPHPAKFWAWKPPSSVICRSDTAALPKVSTGLPTNSIELERLSAARRRALVGKTRWVGWRCPPLGRGLVSSPGVVSFGRVFSKGATGARFVNRPAS